MNLLLVIGILLVLLFAGCSRPKPAPPPPAPPPVAVKEPEKGRDHVPLLVYAGMASSSAFLLWWQSRHPRRPIRVHPPDATLPSWTDHSDTRNGRLLDIHLPLAGSKGVARRSRQRRLPPDS